MKTEEHGRGTVRTVRDRARKVLGYRALLPRELSTPPADCRNPDRYQEPVGPMFATREEARALLDAAIVEVSERRQPALANGLTFSWYVRQEIQARLHNARRKYENEARANRAVSTWRSIERCWLVDAEWKDLPPSAIGTDEVQRFITWLTDEAEGTSGEPLSSDFIRNVARLIRAAFARAMVKPNPARDIVLPPKGKPRVRYLELAAQRRLFGSREIPLPDRIMAGCGMGAGLRVGELLAMEEQGVRLDDPNPHLWVEFGGSHHAPTKSGKARRVELFEPGLGFWRLWMETYYAGGRMVFPGPSGGYLKHWPERFPDWARHAEVERLTSHGMRHSYAVAMLSGTWGYEPRSLEFVSQQLGHAELQTTQRFYGAFEQGTWQREVQRMTGRVVPVGQREAITARELLGLAADGSASGNDGAENGSGLIQAAAVGSDLFSRRSPKTQVSPQKAAPNDALAHQARRVLELIAAGDPFAITRAVELCQRVIREAAEQSAEGGQRVG